MSYFSYRGSSLSGDQVVRLSSSIENQGAIAQLSQSALSNVPLVDLFQQAVTLVARVLKISGSDYWQVLSDGQKLQRVASTQGVSDCSTISAQDHSTLNHLLSADEPVVLANPSPDPSQNGLQLLFPGHIHGAGYVLSSGRNFPLGVLTIYSHQSQPLTAKANQFLQVVTHLLGTAVERKRSEALLIAQTQVLEQVAAGSQLSRILNSLCLLLEQELPGAFCSVLLLDETTNTLQSGIGPSLPEDYAQALNGLIIGERSGSCGTAAYRGEPVFVNDIATDPLWSSFRDLALSHNIRACWSIPFFSKVGEVLGTFALSHQIPCQPNHDHIQIMKTAAHLASIATKNHLIGERLRQQALYDSLTKLANRHAFTDQLRLRLQKQQHDQLHAPAQIKEFAVLFLDVDRFKLVNDSLGHTVGDQFLQALSQRLLPCLNPQDLFARLGGDEFGILLHQVKDAAEACRVVDCLRAALATPLQVGTHEIMASISIGVVHSSGGYCQLENMLRDADMAMYQAKINAQESYVVFDQKMHASVLARLQIEHDLRCAVKSMRNGKVHPFQLYYQPIVSLETGKILGFEALIRWLHPSCGLISPDEFIPIAEETGLVVPLGNWVIEEGCQQLRQWQINWAAPRALSMSFNISARQFAQPDLVFRIQDALERYQLSAASLKLEITESVLLETACTITERLEQLRAIGVQMSLDDFGTGYSSLRYLNDFPVDTLKIDRSFVQNLKRHEGKIIQAIVGLAQNLGMTVIAEGIETLEQLDYLKKLGCDQGQGYFFSRPLPKVSAEKVLHNLS
ncbi:MAG: EAL domain-containing protein [Cyanobacteria bacterium P01_A01_bin.123]